VNIVNLPDSREQVPVLSDIDSQWKKVCEHGKPSWIWKNHSIVIISGMERYIGMISTDSSQLPQGPTNPSYHHREQTTGDDWRGWKAMFCLEKPLHPYYMKAEMRYQRCFNGIATTTTISILAKLLSTLLNHVRWRRKVEIRDPRGKTTPSALYEDWNEISAWFQRIRNRDDYGCLTQSIVSIIQPWSMARECGKAWSAWKKHSIHIIWRLKWGTSVVSTEAQPLRQ
jgi:hypothetical protein